MEDSWIKQASAWEHVRRKRLDELEKAWPDFRVALVKEIELEIAEYNAEFPTDQVFLEKEPGKKVRVKNHAYTPPTEVELTLDRTSAAEGLNWEFFGAEGKPGRVELDLTEGALRLNFGANLLARILGPVLFPKLHLDAKR
jgi:hypothetical protein